MVTTSPELAAGQLLDGRYRIIGRVARGGMATVYEALDTRLHREVAVKVMHASLAADEEFVQRFVREARSAARLSHPNVVAVFDQGSQVDERTGEDCVYLVMELVRGRTLRQVLRERGPLPPADALAVLEPVLAALRAAHDAGIVHRDVKPENVLLADDGRVEVADFGLARAVNSAAGHTATRGVLLGTVSYLAPEQVVDGTADARTDVYSAGIMLFEMLTGTKPHEGDSPIAVAYKHVNDDVPRPSALRPGIPPAVDRLVRRATDRRPEQRFADGREFLTAVRATRDLLRQHPDRPRTEAPPGPLPRVAARSGAAVARPPGAARIAPPGGAVSGNTTAIGLAPAPPYPRGARVGSTTGSLPRPAPGPPAPARPTPADLAAVRRATLARRRRRRGIGAVLAVVLLAIVVAAVAWWVGDGRFAAVPRLSGLPVAQAEASASSAGLRLSVSARQWNDTYPAGYVISASDPAQERLARGSTVGVVVSLGAQRHVLPKVVGLQESAAAAAIRSERLAVGAIRSIWDAAHPSGQVVDSDPAAGKALKAGTPVIMTVSRGPEPVTVPDVLGLPGPQAANSVRAVGVGVLVVDAASDTVPAGQVVSQTPAAGNLRPDAVVTLVVSTGPPPVRIPWLVGASQASATATLTALGLKVTVVHFRLYVGLNRVFSVSKLPGTTVPRGSTVVITLI